LLAVVLRSVILLVLAGVPGLAPAQGIQLITAAGSSALAARSQGKYLLAHDALMNAARLAQKDQVDAVLKRAGIDIDRLAKEQSAHVTDIDALLARNDAETQALHLRGTPGLLIGKQLLPGMVDLTGLKQLVALVSRRSSVELIVRAWICNSRTRPRSLPAPPPA
jgi:protein-disulfide isomerase